MELLFFAMVLGIIPAAIAQSKGRPFFGWWIYGSLLFIVAIIHALCMAPIPREIERRQLANGMKKCPHCAEVIKEEARVCRFCGRDLPQEASAA